jgi:hypothetical protein
MGISTSHRREDVTSFSVSHSSYFSAVPLFRNEDGRRNGKDS